MPGKVENEDDFAKGYEQALNDVISLIKEKLGELVAELESWRDDQ